MADAAAELRKQRPRFLGRISHDALTYLDPRVVVTIKPPNSLPAQIYQLLHSRGAPETCYAMSMSDIDGRILPLSEALEVAVGFGMPSIISCCPGQLAYLEAEQSFGPPDRHILFRRATRST